MKKTREKIVHKLYQYDLVGFVDTENERVLDVIDKIDEIDDIISDNLFNYSIERLSYIDRAIIRYATYELKYTDLATAIIINEAVDLTKSLSDLDDERQHKFNNSVIDNISKDIRG